MLQPSVQEGTSPLAVTFTAVVTNPGATPLTFFWSYGNGDSNSTRESSITYTYSEAGTYTANVTVTNGQSTAAAGTSITVTAPAENPDPDPDPEPEPDPDPAPPPNPGPGVPYKGEWVWLFKSESTGVEYNGLLSISRKMDDSTAMKNAGGGAWRWCTASCSSLPSGVGGIFTFIDEDRKERLSTLFMDLNGDIKLVGFDSDNRIGNEVEGDPTFLGPAAWLSSSGREDYGMIGMVKISNTPSIQSASGIAFHSITVSTPELSTTAIDADLEKVLLEALRQKAAEHSSIGR